MIPGGGGMRQTTDRRCSAILSASLMTAKTMHKRVSSIDDEQHTHIDDQIFASTSASLSCSNETTLQNNNTMAPIAIHADSQAPVFPAGYAAPREYM
jgi:hypothetical protein